MSYDPHDTDKGRAPWGKCIDCKHAVRDPMDAPFCPNCKVFHESVMGGITDTKSNTDARLTIKKKALKRIREEREKEEFYEAIVKLCARVNRYPYYLFEQANFKDDDKIYLEVAWKWKILVRWLHTMFQKLLLSI